MKCRRDRMSPGNKKGDSHHSPSVPLWGHLVPYYLLLSGQVCLLSRLTLSALTAQPTLNIFFWPNHLACRIPEAEPTLSKH